MIPVAFDYVAPATVEEALADVCRLLDGSPLAIELAAARVRLVGVEALRDSLESGLEMLRTTAPDVPERQRALATTIAWSHDRLGDGARQLCRRLVVFEQAFTLEAVEAVGNPEGDLGIDTLDGLTSLIDNSLVGQTEMRDGEPRFSMLETIRELIASPVEDDILLRARRPLMETYDNALKTNSGWMSLVARAQTEGERIERFTRARDRLAAITAAQVQATAARYLQPDQRLEIVVLPRVTGTP